MQYTIEEVTKAAAIVAHYQAPSVNAECAFMAHQEAEDYDDHEEISKVQSAMRDQFLRKLLAQDRDALAHHLIAASAPKGLALSLLARQAELAWKFPRLDSLCPPLSQGRGG